MRAIFSDSISVVTGETLTIDGDLFHHLKNVVRIKKNESLLILNGKGQKTFSTVMEIEKRKLTVCIDSIEFEDDRRRYDVLFCITKKASVELAIKMAVELNIKNLYLVESEFSQRLHTLKEDRVMALVESGVIQSNAAYMTQTHLIDDFDGFIESHSNHYDEIHMFDLKLYVNEGKSMDSGKKLIVIGPEGGLSEHERQLIVELKNAYLHYLPVNIMRAPTALAAAVGHLLGIEK